MLTEGVSVSVLTADCVGDMGTDAHIDHGEVCNTEARRVQTTDDSESTTGVDLLADGVQLRANSGQQKVVLVDFGAIKAQVLKKKKTSALVISLIWLIGPDHQDRGLKQ